MGLDPGLAPLSGAEERVFVIIPALNEEDSIGFVLEALPRARLARVIVVDNGSTDRTAERARQGGAHTVHEPQRGYGRACLTGMAALPGPLPQDIVVFLDGDFSDHPEEIDALLGVLRVGDADFVVGSRIRGTAESGALLPQARFGNRLACWLMRWFFGARFTDLGPFRAIRWGALQSLAMSDEGFGWTIEMQVKAVHAALNCQEVPVSYRRRVGHSKITGTLSGTVRAGAKILWTIFRLRWVLRR